MVTGPPRRQRRPSAATQAQSAAMKPTKRGRKPCGAEVAVIFSNKHGRRGVGKDLAPGVTPDFGTAVWGGGIVGWRDCGAAGQVLGGWDDISMPIRTRPSALAQRRRA
ncbi:unnamed protein product [Acidocella sp. C78]|nr:unnamed protein product [Acidocella sp. C78]